MAIGLSPPSQLLPVDGVWLSSYAAGIRYAGRDDVVLVELSPGACSTAVFTRNAFCAAPVAVAKKHIAQSSPRYVLVNSGNANAGTGDVGERDALFCCQKIATLMQCREQEVLPMSTGVIGERLPVERVALALPHLKSRLTDNGWLSAAKAIMTTDTVPKGISRQLEIEGKTITITGIAKGAGMIRPDMATMLAFVATDAMLSPDLLERALRNAVKVSFNSISVDGDTSTNDACLLSATGKAGVEISKEDASFQAFSECLIELMTYLAQAIVRDGEGATKFITVWVKGATSHQEAREVAFSLAHSPLVKTAFYAEDPNWGRILAAVGRAEVEKLNISRVDIALEDVVIFRNGAIDSHYTESAGQVVMKKPDITVCIDLHRGQDEARIWTTDLSHEYVRINAEYRT